MKVTAALDSNQVTIGDQLLLHFHITQPLGLEYQSADFLQAFDTLEQVELLEIYDHQALNANNPQTIKQSIRITSFEDGTHLIPPITFAAAANGKTYQARSNIVYLTVQPVDIDTTAELRPIKDIMEEPITLRDYLPYIIIPIAIIFGLFLLYLLFKKLKGGKTEQVVVAKKVILPAHVIALDKLKGLQERELWQKGEIKEYYSEISYIAREYLENRYHINALESVTPQIIPDLKQQDISNQQRETFIQMLRTSDMVKFAKVKPTEETHHQVMNELQKFITNTQKIIIETTSEEETTNNE